MWKPCSFRCWFPMARPFSCWSPISASYASIGWGYFRTLCAVRILRFNTASVQGSMGVRYPIIWPDCLGKGSLCASVTFIRNLLSWLPCVLFFRSNCMFAVWFGKKNSRQVCNQIWKVENLFLIVAELLIWISLRLADLLVLKFVWIWQKYQSIWICEPFPCDESRIETPFLHNDIFFWELTDCFFPFLF